VNHFILFIFSFLSAYANVNELYGNLFSSNPEEHVKAGRASSLKKLQNLEYAQNTTIYSELARRALPRSRGEPFHNN
jgi:hypothetical protein